MRAVKLCIFAVGFALSTVRAHALSNFQLWQLTYFGSTVVPAAASTADPDGDGQNNQTEFISGFDPTNSASFWLVQASLTNGLAPLLVNFSDNVTTLAVTNQLWDFGDGNTGSGATPTHTYLTPGVFTVSETLFNIDGTAALTKTDFVTAVPEPSTFALSICGLLLLAVRLLRHHKGQL